MPVSPGTKLSLNEFSISLNNIVDQQTKVREGMQCWTWEHKWNAVCFGRSGAVGWLVSLTRFTLSVAEISHLSASANDAKYLLKCVARRRIERGESRHAGNLT